MSQPSGLLGLCLSLQVFFQAFFGFFMSLLSRTLCLSSAVLVLGACSYLQEKSYQKVTFETPGAEFSKCHVYVQGLHYPVEVPGTITVANTREDMEVRCLAPGNRVRTAVIPAEVSPVYHNNASNAYLGAVWDAASGAMYKYPDIIRIDFNGVEQKDYPLPKHDAYDLRPTYEYALEEFLPSQPRLNADRYAQPTVLKKIDRSSGGGGGLDAMSSAFGPVSENAVSHSGSTSRYSPPELPISLSDLATRSSVVAGVEEFPSVPSTAFDDDFSRFNGR